MDHHQVLDRVLKEMGTDTFDVGTAHIMEVTHVDDPKSFYVRLASLSEDYVLSVLEDQGEPLADKYIYCSRTVVYKSRLLMKFVRGKVEGISHNENGASCTIFALDYGHCETDVPSNEIYQPANNMDCLALALHCELYLCHPGGESFSKVALDAFKFYIAEGLVRIKIKVKNGSKYTVKMRTPDHADVASTMALCGFTSIIDADNSVHRSSKGAAQPLIVKKYQFKKVNVGDRLVVKVLSGVCVEDFYVAEISEYKKFVKINVGLTKHCKDQGEQDIIAAVTDKRCSAVKMIASGKYERAEIKKITVEGSKAVVQLVDTGEIIQAHYTDIKKVTSAPFNTTPALAIYCAGVVSKVWETDPYFLHPDHKFVIEILKEGRGFDIPHTVNIQKLPSQGF